MKNILFLCTGNSCRSQMAEAWGAALQSKDFNFFSAGTKKHGLNPLAVKVMQEAGIDIRCQQSKIVDDELLRRMDLVVTVCSDAHENCPHVSGLKVIHHGFDDPPFLARGLSDEESVLKIYRRVRDEIKAFIKELNSYVNKAQKSELTELR